MQSNHCWLQRTGQAVGSPPAEWDSKVAAGVTQEWGWDECQYLRASTWHHLYSSQLSCQGLGLCDHTQVSFASAVVFTAPALHWVSQAFQEEDPGDHMVSPASYFSSECGFDLCYCCAV